MQFTVEFDTSHLSRALAAVRQQVEHPTDMLGAIGEALMIKNRDRHERGVGPDGTPWKPLAQSTIGNDAWKKQDASNRKGNSRRGAFIDLKVARDVQSTRRVLWDTKDMLGPQFHPDVTGDTLRLGFSINRATWHHFGTKPYTILPKRAPALTFGGMSYKRVNHPGLPARPLIGFPDEDAQATADVVEDYLLRALQQARGA